MSSSMNISAARSRPGVLVLVLGALVVIVGLVGAWRVAEALSFAWGVEGLLMTVGATACVTIAVAYAVRMLSKSSKAQR